MWKKNMESQECKCECKSGFAPAAGMKLVFDPALRHGQPPKKNPCADCHFCQQCGESRCNTCRGGKQKAEGRPKKLSFSEQIRLYEEINAKERAEAKTCRGDAVKPGETATRCR